MILVSLSLFVAIVFASWLLVLYGKTLLLFSTGHARRNPDAHLCEERGRSIDEEWRQLWRTFEGWGWIVSTAGWSSFLLSLWLSLPLSSVVIGGLYLIRWLVW